MCQSVFVKVIQDLNWLISDLYVVRTVHPQYSQMILNQVFNTGIL